ncbi:MAG: lipopolysaccharide assembly protein LapA domain-containing protein [Corynebacterium sp.]|nr:lipopolysaccharide assembly protein LapA domain-containing protein [Corynebacterium sp.]
MTSPFNPNANAEANVSSVEPTVSSSEVARAESRRDSREVKGSFAGSTWAALIIGALLLIVLIVFMLQNQHPVPVTLFAWSGTLPAGIAFLLFAIGGALVMSLVGGWRMIELRRQVKNR